MMPTVFEEAGDLLFELADEAVRGGASDWYVAGIRKKVANLRDPSTIEEARRVKGFVDSLVDVTRRRSARFDEIVAELDELLLPIDAVWRLGGTTAGDA